MKWAMVAAVASIWLVMAIEFVSLEGQITGLESQVGDLAHNVSSLAIEMDKLSNASIQNSDSISKLAHAQHVTNQSIALLTK